MTNIASSRSTGGLALFPAPDACTLPAADQPARRGEIDELLRWCVRRPERPEPQLLVLSLPDDDDLRQWVGHLLDRESACCGFFDFRLTVVAGVTRVDVRVPPGHTAVLDAIHERGVELHAPTGT